MDRLGELERLRLVFDHLPDEKLVCILKNEGMGGRMILCVVCGTAGWHCLYTFNNRFVDQENMTGVFSASLHGQPIYPILRQVAKQEQQAGWQERNRSGTAVKPYRSVCEKKRKVKCFGFKLHLIVDATSELPVAFRVTKASAADVTEGTN